jgi:hypothetical protein
MLREIRRGLALGLIALATCTSFAQTLIPTNPDWREAEAPPPPALKTDRLIEIDMPRSQLRFGVDPSSVSLGSDGIVRYVVVASSSTGAVNASYEGIRCGTGEFKVYARHNPDSGWVRAQDDWRSLHDSSLRSRHSLEIARNGACVGHGTSPSAEQIVRDLRAGIDTRFRPERR